MLPTVRREDKLPSVIRWGLVLLDWIAYLGLELLIWLLTRAHEIGYWLDFGAPIILKYRLRKIGLDGIDRLPFLSWETKQELKRWLRKHL